MSASPLTTLAGTRVLPVVTIHDPAAAGPLVATLADAGLTTVEITLRTDAALEAIRRASDEVPDAIIGAGTVTSPAGAAGAIDAGARFLVSPGLSPEVIDVARRHDLPAIPGIATATELQHAVHLGCPTVKLFPAEVIGGPRLVEALGAVWPDVAFVPTGGVSASNAGTYLSSPRVLAVGGSWMVPRAAVDGRDWSTIGDLASAAARIGRDAR